jgi:hypothetical protein
MTQMGATRQLEAVRRTGYASSRGWLARVFWPKTTGASDAPRATCAARLAAAATDACACRNGAAQRAAGI